MVALPKYTSLSRKKAADSNAKKHPHIPRLTIGQQFGSWIVKAIPSYTKAWCICVCGCEKLVRQERLRNGTSKSCGCQRLANLITHGRTTKEFRASSHEYWIWNSMLDRCFNKNNRGYNNYGGRGITVCERWLKFENFYSDMGTKPPGKSIERRDNNLGYFPDNCYWATRHEQAKNTRRNRMITVDGVTKCISEWARELGISHSAIILRIKYGWSEKLAVTTPKNGKYGGKLRGHRTNSYSTSS